MNINISKTWLVSIFVGLLPNSSIAAHNTSLYLDMRCISPQSTEIELHIRNISSEEISLDKKSIGMEQPQGRFLFHVKTVVQEQNNKKQKVWRNASISSSPKFKGSMLPRTGKNKSLVKLKTGEALRYSFDIERDFELVEDQYYSYTFGLEDSRLIKGAVGNYSIVSNTLYIAKGFCSEIGKQKAFY